MAVGALGGALGVLAAGGLAASATAAADFESQLTEIEKVTSAETAAELNDEILKMAETIPLSTDELADITEQAGRFGVEGTEAITDFVTTTAKMATATDLNASAAGESFARLTTLLGEPVTNINNLGSSINALSNNAATSSQEIVDSMIRSSGALKQLGLSTEEIIALSGSINEVSESSERAGTRLRRVGQEIVGLRGNNLDAVVYGLNMTEEAFNSMRQNAPLELMRKLSAGLGESGERARALRKGLSVVSQQALTGFASNLEGFDDALQLTNSQMEEGSSLQREFEAAVGTTKAQFQLLVNQLDTAAITTGQVLLPSITSLLQTLQSGVSTFNEINERTEGMAGAVGLAASSIGLLTVAVGSFLGGPAAALVAAAAAIGTAYATNFGGVQDAAEGVGDALSSELVATAQTARDVLLPILSQLAQAFGLTGDNIGGSIGGIVTAVTNTLVPGIESAGQSVRDTLWSLADYWSTHGARVTAEMQTMVSNVQTTVSSGLSTLQSVTQSSLSTATSIWQDYAAAVTGSTGAIDTTYAVTQTTLNTLAGLTISAMSEIEGAWDNYGTSVESATAAVDNTIGESGAGLTTLANVTKSALYEIEGAWDNYGVSIETAAGAVEDANGIAQSALSTLWITTKSTLTEAEYLWGQYGSTIQSSVSDNITSAVTATQTGISTLRSVTQSALNTAESVWQSYGVSIEDVTSAVTTVVSETQSGLATLRSVTQSRIAQVVVVWQEYEDDVRAAVDAVVSVVTTNIPNALVQLRDRTRALLTQATNEWGSHKGGIIDAVQSGFSRAQDIVQSGFNTLRSKTSAALDVLSEWWDDHDESIKGAVRDAFSRTKTIVQEGLSALKTKTQPLLDDVSQFWGDHEQDIKGAVGDAMDYVKTHPEQALTALATTVLPGPVGLVVDVFKENWGKIETEVKETFNAVKQDTRTSMQAVKNQIIGPLTDSESRTRANLRSMKEEFSTTYTLIKQSVNNLVGNLVGDIGQHMRDMSDLVAMHLSGEDGILHNYRTALNSIWENVVRPILNIMQGFWRAHGDEVEGIVRGLLNTLMAITETGVDLLATIFNVGLDLISQDFDGAMRNINGFIRRLFNRVNEWVSSTGLSLFRDAIDLVIGVVVGTFEWLYDQVIGNSIIKDLFVDTVAYIRGTAKGLVDDAITAVTDTAAGIFRDLRDGAKYIVKDLFQTVSTYISSGGYDTLVGSFWSVAEGIKSSFSNSLSGVVDGVESVLDGVLDAIRSAVNSAEDIADIEIGVHIPDAEDILEDAEDAISDFLGGGEDPTGGSGGAAGSGGGNGYGGSGGTGGGGGVGGGGIGSPIPGMATGGVVREATKAVVGEGRYPEAVVPLQDSGRGPLGAAVESSMRAIVSDETLDSGDVAGGEKHDYHLGGVTIELSGSATEEDGRRVLKGVTDELRSIGAKGSGIK